MGHIRNVKVSKIRNILGLRPQLSSLLSENLHLDTKHIERKEKKNMTHLLQLFIWLRVLKLVNLSNLSRDICTHLCECAICQHCLSTPLKQQNQATACLSGFPLSLLLLSYRTPFLNLCLHTYQIARSQPTWLIPVSQLLQSKHRYDQNFKVKSYT